MRVRPTSNRGLPTTLSLQPWQVRVAPGPLRGVLCLLPLGLGKLLPDFDMILLGFPYAYALVALGCLYHGKQGQMGSPTSVIRGGLLIHIGLCFLHPPFVVFHYMNYTLPILRV
jgi:hypothetical protein